MKPDQHPKIIILDDDSNLRKTISDFLSVKGFLPIPLALGRQALELAGREEIAVALIDLRLDDMPGLEVLRSFREISPLTECILLTGHASQDTAIQAVNLGALFYFQKPFSIDQLILSVIRAVEKREASTALAESQARYHTFINATTDMAFLKDDQFRYLIVNETNASFIGKPVEEIIGKLNSELMPVENARACRASDEKAIKKKKLVVTIENVRGRIYETRKFPVELKDGKLGVGGYVRDVTERKQAEDSLKASENRYRSLFEDSPISLWVQDCSAVKNRLEKLREAGITDIRSYLESHPQVVKECAALVRIVDVNKASLKLFRAKSKKELLGGLAPLLEEESYTNFVEELIYISEGKTRFNLNDVNQALDGTRLDVSLSWNAAPGHEDDLSKVILSVIDVTERNRAVEALQENQRRLATLMSNLPGMAYRCKNDSEWTLEYISEGCYPLTGYRPKKLVGSASRTFSELIMPDDRHLVRDVIGAALKERQPYQLNYRIKCAGGEEKWVWEQGRGVFNPQGDMIALEGFITDITDRKRASDAVQASEERYRLLADHMSDSIWLLDMSLNIVYISPSIFRQRGYTIEEFITLPLERQMPPDSLRQMMELFSTALSPTNLAAPEPRLSYNIELEFFCKDGSKFWSENTFTIILGSNGQPENILVTGREITQRKLAEEKIKNHIKELEILYENGLAISGLLDVGQIGHRLIDVIANKLHWHHAIVRLIEPESRRLQVLAFNHPGISEDEEQRTIERLNKKINKPGKGLSGWVIQHGQPVRVNNVQSDKRYVRSFPGIRSGLYVPLKVGDLTIGSVAVESKANYAFSDQDERMLMTAAAQAALAIDSARMYEKAVQTAQRNAALHQASLEIVLAGSEPDAIYSALQRAVKRVMQSDAFNIFRINVDKGEFQSVYLVEDDKRYFNVFFPLDDLSDQIIKKKRSLVIKNLMQEKKIKKDLFRENPQFRSFLGSPLFSGKKVIGVISTQSREEGQYSAVDQAFLETLASEGMIALENARLYKDVKVKLVERQQAEKGLRQSEEKYRLLAEELEQRVKQRTDEIETARQRLELATKAAHLGIWDRDLQSGQEIWDDNIPVLYGLTPNEVESRQVDRFARVHPDDLKTLVDYEKKVLADERDYNIEYRILWPNGSPHYIKSQAIIIYGEDKQPRRMIGIDHEITDRKKAEETLRLANLEMERALRIKDEFLANMSHELRTPLNAVLGISESLVEQTAGPLNEKQIRYIHTISESGHHLLELINDILDLSKIEAGRMIMAIQDASADPIFQSSLRMIKELAQKKRLTVSFETDNQVKTLHVDERRIKQVLVNLLSNAVKFTPEGGKIGLEVIGNPEARQVTLTVWDNGIGIPAGSIDRLFKPFVLLDSGLNREHPGTGLGLALVAQMVRLHGGRVGLESKEGKGSRFFIVLPWAPEVNTAGNGKTTPAMELPGVKAEKGSLQRGKILLVEDTESVIMFLTDYLEGAGYQVIIARDGEDGVEKLGAQIPDLILMDIQMPGMDGFEATRMIRRKGLAQNIPIIALTALAMEGDRERCLAAGMNDYMSKPIHLKELVQVIEKQLKMNHGGIR